MLEGMKKAVILFVLFFGFSLFLPKETLAYLQGGCIVGNYVCNGTVAGSTCKPNAQGTQFYWDPGPAPTEQQAQTAGCPTQAQFTSAGNPFFNPTPTSFGDELYGSNPELLSSGRWVKMVAGDIGLSVAADAIGLPGQPANQPTAVGFLASGIDTMTRTRPASSIDYIAYMGNQLHVPGTPSVAYAASFGPGGLGFTSLAPVLQLWTISRNLAYLIFAIIFVVVGIMIMLRVKIDPKTAATIQNSLPKIIFALILVTFSYAIAGFLIDLMYVALALIIALMNSVMGSQGPNLQTLLSGSIFNFVADPNGLWKSGTSAAAAVGNIVDNVLTGGYGSSTIGKAFGFLGSSLAFVVIAIAILVALFRTWLTLLGAYVNIIMSVIGAPLMLMMDAIPGQNQFGNWIRSMLSNLLVFPLVTILLAVGQAIVTNLGKGEAAATGFMPPLVGAGNMGAATGLIGLGIILTIPKALNILQDALKTPPFKYGNAWLESTQAGAQGSLIAGRFADKQAGRVEVGGVKVWPAAKGAVKGFFGI